MKIIERLHEIVSSLEEAKTPYLVMGGHAVRYYGFRRETTDHDLHIPEETGKNLSQILLKTSLFSEMPLVESITWRGETEFKRYVIGVLPDGKEELLEFWIRNHLLDNFETLYKRREEGLYEGKKVNFLSIADLIRSKETERENDWRDISFLEEIQDERNISNANTDEQIISSLSCLRSVKGFQLATAKNLVANISNVQTAFQNKYQPIAQAFLAPLFPSFENSSVNEEIIPLAFQTHLKNVVPGGSRHLALVEAIRLRYKRAKQLVDRADKDAHLQKQNT